MTVGIVVNFKVVQIDEEDGEWLRISFCPVDFQFQPFLEVAMIIKAGEIVMGGQFFQPCVSGLQRQVVLLQRLDQCLVLAVKIKLFQSPVGGIANHLSVFERFDQKVVGAGAHGIDGSIYGSIAVHHNDLGQIVLFLNELEQFNTGHVRNFNICDDKGEGPLDMRCQGFRRDGVH